MTAELWHHPHLAYAAVLHGKVGDGQGYASGKNGGGPWLRDPFFTRMLGSRVHPGSINVFINAADHFDLIRTKHPHFRDHDESLRPVDIRKRGYLLARPCTINEYPAWLMRTEHPGPRFPTKRPPPVKPPHTMFEVVASQRLGWVEYGVDVELVVDFSVEPLMLPVRRRRA